MSNTFEVEVGGKKVSLKTVPINNKVRSESQPIYAAALRQAVTDGLYLKVELDKVLEAKGLLNTEKEQVRIDELRSELKQSEISLRKRIGPAGSLLSKDEGRKLALHMRKLRGQIGDIGQTILSLYTNSAENFASNEQNKYLIFATTLTESGSTYWKNFEEFKTDSDNPVYGPAISSFLKVNGADNSVEKEYPENKWLVRMGYLNNDLEFIDSKGRLIDEDGRLINKDGRFINDNGEYIDKYGNRVDEKGNLLVEDGWAEESKVST